jgi:hypothetical protein
MPKHPWSKLQKQLYLLFDPEIDLQIHCSVVRMESRRGRTDLPRYWITLDGEILWDYPGHFVVPGGTGRTDGSFVKGYPYSTDIAAISQLIREYIDTPSEDLLTRRFESDHWGLVNIFRAADRRIGRRQWPSVKRKTHNQAALKVLAVRDREAEVVDRHADTSLPRTTRPRLNRKRRFSGVRG